MCGRYTLTSLNDLVRELSVLELPMQLAPRYNIAPTQMVPIVDNRPKAHRILLPGRWGLIPRWAKDPAIGTRMINARSETAAEKPAFRDALRRRRCLVVADGFYEWKRQDKARTPFYVRRVRGGLMAFAGLWEPWTAPGGQPVCSFSILTTSANQLIAPIHDRMPVIIEPAHYDRWLAPEPLGPEAVAELLAPAPAAALEAYEVSKLVGSPRNDVPACIEPAKRQPSLFE